MHDNVVLSCSPKQTRNIGKSLAQSLKPGDIIGITGDLGSGKTTITKGIVHGLGVRNFVRSPSYIIVNEYITARVKVFHIDLYRLQGKEVHAIGLEEYLFGDGVCIIEWADRLKQHAVPYRIRIAMSWKSEKERNIKVQVAP